jgi:hypothetical protein
MTTPKTHIVQKLKPNGWEQDSIPLTLAQAERHLLFESKHHPKSILRIVALV